MPALTSRDGTTIVFETIGNGPAVILVDGALCFRDYGPMRPIAEQLADQFTLYLYDRRGRGESTDTLPFSVAREIEDLDAIIAAAGGTACLLGISSGAALVLAAAASLGPGKVSRIALFEPPYMPEETIPAAAAYTRDLTTTLADGHNRDAVELFLRRVGIPPEQVQAMRHSPTWPATEELAPTLAYDDAIMGDGTVPVSLAKRVLIPTLTLAGGASPASLRYGAEELATVIPNAHMEVIEGQTHAVTGDAIAPHLVAFFSERTADVEGLTSQV
jgi:Predicted hydrolases or acyltransferases (alpha/beta hydrolase superfamily)